MVGLLLHVPAGRSGPAVSQGCDRRFATSPRSRAQFYTDPVETVKDIRNRATVTHGAFGLCGNPENLMAALLRTGRKDLKLVSSNVGVDDFGRGLFLATKPVRGVVCSYLGENTLCEQQRLEGELDLELPPQGTQAEHLHAPTGYRTLVQEGGARFWYYSDGSAAILSQPREVREFQGQH